MTTTSLSSPSTSVPVSYVVSGQGQSAPPKGRWPSMCKQIEGFAAEEDARPRCTEVLRMKIWANSGVNPGCPGATRRIHGVIFWDEATGTRLCRNHSDRHFCFLPSELPTAHTTEQMSKWSQGCLPQEVPNTIPQTNRDAIVINYNPYSGRLIEFNGSHTWMENNGQGSTQVIQPSTSAEAVTQERRAGAARPSDSFQRCRKARFYAKSSHFYTLASNSHF